ncbi:MAG: hypothetical protein CL588_04310 [Alteromonadaceae bacterium]|nr:hypothetical protein [Alteromonadaceae bacterium]
MSQNSEQTTASDVTSSELLEAVKGFLMDSALPALSGRDQFNARVAANVLGIIDREQQVGPELAALDAAAAQQWLPGDSGSGTALQQLSRALAAREIDADTDFFEYLKQRQLLVAAINNPRYASRKVAEERWRSES